jgi:hypothetical protein
MNTPITDAFAIKFKTPCGEKYWVPVDISRNLERERDEAREQLALTEKNLEISMQQTKQAVQDRADEHVVLIQQRDEAREQRDRLAEASKSLLRHIKQIRSGDSPLVHPLLIESMDNSAAKLDAALQSLTTNEP